LGNRVCNYYLRNGYADNYSSNRHVDLLMWCAVRQSVASPEMGRLDRNVASRLTQTQLATPCVGHLRRHRHRRPGQRSRFRCVASPPSSSPNSTSGGRIVGCLYRKIRMRSRCTSINMVKDRGHYDMIDHVIEVDYFRSVSVDLDRRQSDDAIIFPSANSSNSSSPTHESITSYSVNNINQLPVDDETGTGSCHRHEDIILSSSTGSPNSSSSANDVSESITPNEHLLPIDNRTETGTGSLRHVEIVLRYKVGRLGVAVGGARPVKVRVVRQGGEGQLAGLAVGDAIIAVEGHDVSHAQPEVVAALLRSWTGDTLHLTVARPERDDSGHASSSSLSSHDDVTDIASGYSCLPTLRDANYTRQSTSGKQYGNRLLFFK